MMTAIATRRNKFEEAAFPHIDALLWMALWLTKRWSRAEYLVFKAVITAYHSWDRTDGAVDSKVRLFRVLVRTFRDSRSRKRKPVRLRAQSRAMAGGPGDSLGPSHLSPIDSRGLSLLYEIPGVVFRGAIARLRAQSRLIMLLRFREQFSYDEIAFITDASQDTVRSALSRYRQSIPRYMIELEDRIVGTAKGSASIS